MSQSIAKRIASQMIRMSVLTVVVLFGETREVKGEDVVLNWAKSMGSNKDDLGYSIAVDGSGNVYATGHFQGTVDFDPGSGTHYLTSAGSYDLFIMKLSPTGDLVWAKSVGSNGSGYGYSIAVDGSGNVYVTGHFKGTGDFDPGPGTHYLTSAGIYDPFLMKLSPTGDLLWAKSVGGNGYDCSYSIAVDGSGNVYATGSFIGTGDFDPGPGTHYLTSNGGGDPFLMKLAPTGDLLWAKSVGGSSNDNGISIAVDGSGNVYVTGNFSGTADFDPGSGTHYLTSNGSSDPFLMKLSPTGDLLWVKSVGGSSSDYGNSIAVDGSGIVYVKGSFTGTVDFDPGPGTHYLTSAGIHDPFLMKLSPTGDLLWAKSVGSSGGAVAGLDRSIAVDGSGNVYATGAFKGTGDFDPGPGTHYLTSNGGGDPFLMKLSPTGDLLWAKSVGGSSDDNGRSIAVDGSGNVYATGHFKGTGDFDPGPGTHSLTSNGNFDILLMKLSPDVPDNSPPEFLLSSSTTVFEGAELSIEGIATDPDGDDITITFTAASPYPTGLTIDGTTLTWTPDYDQADVYEIGLTADDGNGGIATATLTITVENTNRPPVANAGADIAAECAGVPTTAQLDGSGSSDPDGDEITYAWSADGVQIDDATAAIATGHFPLGETTVTLTVSDEEPLSDSDEAVVTIVDTTPPTIDYTQTAIELWPPNHNMSTAIEGISATDACGGDIVLAVTVSSDEDGMGGAGNTEEDWDVTTAEDGSQSVALRAERSGQGDGREYTVVVTATDASGNSTEQTLTVAVPLSKGNVSDNGNGKGKGRGKEAVAPLANTLNQNYPNPFNAQTQISFDIASTGMVRMELFDITGRTIRTLVDQTYTPGRYRVTWDGRDGAGNEVASGMYIYRLSAGTDVMTKRLMLLR
jgi:hypothetical protein